MVVFLGEKERLQDDSAEPIWVNHVSVICEMGAAVDDYRSHFVLCTGYPYADPDVV
jgi:hypothetical protein